ncbi:MAG: histidine phosphatase family protein [Candidatus Eremiobacteraeota bacterium]|nr:histidine phosphatase family protein [Candidatus Eremiobacteraeota bacterium]
MSASGKTTIHLIRHGDAVPDPDAEIDPERGYDLLGLSAKGRRQAANLAARLHATTPLTAVYSSATLRAHQTAAAVADAFGLAVEHDVRLREIHLGTESVAHLPPAERANAVRERLAAFAAMAVRDGSWASVPDCEPAAEVRARVRAAVDDIAQRHPYEHVALVSHAGTINAYLAAILGTERDFFFPTGNTSLSTVRIEDGRALVVRINDTAHLERRAASEVLAGSATTPD